MINKPQVLAIVPARGGSVSVPKKNIVDVAGKPLIGHTVVSALSAGTIDRVVVSTDSPEIADIARSFGAEVPFLRPSELSRDDTPGILPILHTLGWLEDNQQYKPDYVICLQPTSPLRNADDLRGAMRLLEEKGADSVVSVTPVSHHPYWMKTVDHERRVSDFMVLDRPILRRQELPPVYALNGAIYLAQCDLLVVGKTWYTDRTYAYIMPAERSLDIDTPWDIYLADLILRNRDNENDS